MRQWANWFIAYRKLNQYQFECRILRPHKPLPTYIHAHVHALSEKHSNGYAIVKAPLCTNTVGKVLRAEMSFSLVVTDASTVHDTENLTFSEEFRGCAARNNADFPHGCRGTSARAPRIFRAGGRRSSVRAGVDLPRRRARIFRADLVWKWQKPEGELRAQQR